MACQWCHNPEGIRSEPELFKTGGETHTRTMIVGKETSVREIMAAVKKDIIFYDESGGGVTFSGGEPMYQPGFLKSLLTACRDLEIHTAIDTSGCAPTKVFSELSEMTDLLLFDLKIIDPSKHAQYTNVTNDDVLRNLKRAVEQNTPIRIRFPLVPGLTDQSNNLKAVAELIGSLKTIDTIDILPFHRTAEGKYARLRKDNPLPDTAAPDDDKIREVSHIFTERGIRVTVGG